MHEYQIIGRKLPSEKEPSPKLFKMKLFASNEVIAKSRFFYFLRKMKKVKRSAGEIVSISEVYERSPLKIKNFGVWLRYDSRSGTHNMYKEYRELTRTAAVAACYQDMAARHRARFSSIQIIKVQEVKASDVRRPYIKQLITPDLKFPLPHHVARRFKPIFAGKRPTTFH